LRGRDVESTTKGYFGIRPAEARVGDSVYILCGGRVPDVVRKRGKEGCVLIGECAVPRVMDGEVMDNSPAKSLETLILA
jgi:hypothetical protein